eukprot:SAG11_NODE_15697_length_569_cov_0.763830_1_plen_135_part_10
MTMWVGAPLVRGLRQGLPLVQLLAAACCWKCGHALPRCPNPMDEPERAACGPLANASASIARSTTRCSLGPRPVFSEIHFQPAPSASARPTAWEMQTFDDYTWRATAAEREFVELANPTIECEVALAGLSLWLSP